MTRTVLLTTTVVLALVAACMAALVVAAAKPAEAAFPGQNGDLAFLAQLRDGQAATAHAAAPGGSEMRRLAIPAVYQTGPHWSPYGTRVVSTSTGEDPDGEIYMVDANGSSLVNVTKTPTVHESYASWFPSGTRVIYCATPTDGDWNSLGSPQLRAVSLDAAGNTTGTPKTLATSMNRDCGEPVVSPNNAKIAFTRGGQGSSPGGEIYVMRTGTPEGPNNQAVRLTNNSVHDSSPDWSPDSKKIVYTSIDGIWIMNSDGSRKKYLGSGRDPTFSPDGRMIAFVNSSLQYSFDTGGYEMLPAIWTMRKDGTRRTKVIENDDQRQLSTYPPAEDWTSMADPSWQPLP